jgi:hypothetical protein
VNGTEDVYEFEPGGVGSCPRSTSASSPSGCVYLISTGAGQSPSEFADASESGDEVFFTTRQQLVSEDQDELIDLYDARVGGGFPEKSPAAPCSGDACHRAPEVQEEPDSESSLMFSGPGNIVQSVSRQTVIGTPKSLTKSQKLSEALRVCRKKKLKRERASCERSARGRYQSKKVHNRNRSSAKARR